MKINQSKLSPKHNDSFWYDGVIADTDDGKYTLYAQGGIRIYDQDGNIVHDGSKERNNGIEGGLNNDDDLSKIDNNKYIWDMNNWFEIIGENDDGEVYDTYDEAIKALKKLDK